MYAMILPEGNATVFVEQIFRIFDHDGNGCIDFKVARHLQILDRKLRLKLLLQEFMIATDMCSSGTPREKLRWAFKMYDKDASGDI